MRQKSILSLLTFFSTLIGLVCFGQITISGPSCVTSGSTYLYNIQATWDSSSVAQICVTGGILSDSSTDCVTGAEFSSIKISWSDDQPTGTINISFGGSNASLNVNICKALDGGLTDSDSNMQIVDTLTVPGPVACSSASGGNCSPSFNYQWQQSDDGTKWVDIEGANDVGLSISTPLKVTMFYRRKVTESNSGSIAYSDVASVIVNIN